MSSIRSGVLTADGASPPPIEEHSSFFPVIEFFNEAS